MDKFLLISIIIRKKKINLLLINKILRIKKKIFFLKKQIFINFNYLFIKNFYNDFNYNLIFKKNKKKNFLKIFNCHKNVKNFKIISSIKSVFFSNIFCFLEKVLENFLLKIQILKFKYEEILIPIIINYSNLFYSGQIPKFYNNLFKLEKKKFLIPTSEVIINSLSFFIKNSTKFIKIICNSLCFRKEIGNFGKFNSGLKRQNQFKKIEIFQFFKKNFSLEKFYEICSNLIYLLNILKLKFRLIKISRKEINESFISYDFEIWDNIDCFWLEISSISLCLDKSFKKYLKKFQFYSINASCFPIGRLIYLIINSFRINNNYIKIPKKLNKFLTELMKW